MANTEFFKGGPFLYANLKTLYVKIKGLNAKLLIFLEGPLRPPGSATGIHVEIDFIIFINVSMFSIIHVILIVHLL